MGTCKLIIESANGIRHRFLFKIGGKSTKMTDILFLMLYKRMFL
jgi:hypothetical protein